MKRLTWIDIAKGLGIMLVVLAHTRFPTQEMSWWINSFHMPLFFLVAGLCFDQSRYVTLAAYLKRKAVALVYPYFTLSLLAIGLVSLLYFGTDTAWTPVQMLKNMLKGATGGAFWFITVLLETELAYAFISWSVRRPSVRLVACVAASLAAAYLIPKSLPYLIDTALVALSYYAIGHYIRPYLFRLLESVRCQGLFGVVFPVAWGLQLVLIVTVFRYKAGFAVRDFKDPMLYFVLALLGCGGMLTFSILLDRMASWTSGRVGRGLELLMGGVRFLGRNTIVILAFHNFLGLCRSSWHMNGAVSQLLEFLLLAMLLWLLSGPLHFLISFPLKQGPGRQ